MLCVSLYSVSTSGAKEIMVKHILQYVTIFYVIIYSLFTYLLIYLFIIY